MRIAFFLFTCLGIQMTQASYPDCLEFFASGSVTQLVEDLSNGDTFVQTILIEPGATCQIKHTQRAKITYSYPITALYARYTGSSCTFSDWINCPVN